MYDIYMNYFLILKNRHFLYKKLSVRKKNPEANFDKVNFENKILKINIKYFL